MSGIVFPIQGSVKKITSAKILILREWSFLRVLDQNWLLPVRSSSIDLSQGLVGWGTELSRLNLEAKPSQFRKLAHSISYNLSRTYCQSTAWCNSENFQMRDAERSSCSTLELPLAGLGLHLAELESFVACKVVSYYFLRASRLI